MRLLVVHRNDLRFRFAIFRILFWRVNGADRAERSANEQRENFRRSIHGILKFSLSRASLGSLTQPAQISKAVNAGGMAVAPARLQGVTTDEFEANQLKTVGRKGQFWPVDVTEHIGLATAGCARASAPKKF